MSLRFLALLLVAAVAVPALAEERQTSPTEAPPAVKETPPPAEPAAPAPTLKDLLAGGYEVKSVTLVPGDIVKRGGGTTEVDAVMITLQKGPVIATCYDEFGSFANGAFVTLPCTEYK